MGVNGAVLLRPHTFIGMAELQRENLLNGAHTTQEQPAAAAAPAAPGGTTAAAPPPGGPTAAGARGGPPRFPSAEARHWEFYSQNVPHGQCICMS